MSKFIPDSFRPPKEKLFDQFVLKRLTRKDLEIDYKSAMENIDIIHKIRNDSWPYLSLSKDEDFTDLAWHETEFNYRASFAYVIWSKDKKEYLGCVYFYPPSKPWININPKYDAVFNMWVIQKAYDSGLYPIIFKTVKQWLKDYWPFNNVYYSNKEIPV